MFFLRSAVLFLLWSWKLFPFVHVVPKVKKQPSNVADENNGEVPAFAEGDPPRDCGRHQTGGTEWKRLN
jgi:hypothetical protein